LTLNTRTNIAEDEWTNTCRGTDESHKAAGISCRINMTDGVLTTSTNRPIIAGKWLQYILD